MFRSRTIRRFLASRDGTILVLVAMSMAVFLGFVALSFDLGRVASTQSELQSYADNVALAAAGELDGGADACIRAKAAAADLIADTQTFATGDRNLLGDAGEANCNAVTIGDYQLRFLSDLPPDDGTALAGFVTTDPAEAVFAWVQVNEHTVDMPFGNAFAMLTGNEPLDAAVAAEAVAGFTMYACDITPMMFCLPSPDYNANDHIGDQILMRAGGSGEGAWGPGNFGFLDLSGADADPEGPCAGLSNERLSRCLLGAEDFLSKCFSQRGIDTKPGQNTGTYEAAINLRFDMFHATTNRYASDGDYSPAPNVVKGVDDSCGPNPADVPSIPLPEDTCFETGTCADGDRFGDGVWDSDLYVETNHGVDADGNPNYPPGTDATSTRYAMYLAEIAQANGVGSSGLHPDVFAAAQDAFLQGADPKFDGPIYDAFLSALRETDSANDILDEDAVGEAGRPNCSTTRSPDPERRAIILAGVNCDPATGTEISGRATGVPVEEFFKVFLTQPARTDPSNDEKFSIWGEVIGSAGGPGSTGSAGVFRDVVQLYR